MPREGFKPAYPVCSRPKTWSEFDKLIISKLFIFILTQNCQREHKTPQTTRSEISDKLTVAQLVNFPQNSLRSFQSTPPTHYIKIHFNIISLPFTVSYQNLALVSCRSQACYMSCSSSTLNLSSTDKVERNRLFPALDKNFCTTGKIILLFLRSDN